MSPEPFSLSALTLRGELPEDEPFLFKLYCSTRTDEIAAWGWPAPQQAAFLKMQFSGRRHSYRSQFPEADGQIILLQTSPIGRLLVSKSLDEIALVDIALLPEHRNRGIGATLLRNLLAEATRCNQKVCLHVLKSNPAQHLYTRLGFSKISGDELYFQMEWLPQVRSKPPAQ